jgi:hypothetical protein
MSASTITHDSFLQANPLHTVAIGKVFEKELESNEPPTMSFKMSKYHNMGDIYIEGMRKILDILHQDHGVEKVYFNIYMDSIPELESMESKKAMPIQKIFEILAKIQELFNQVDEEEDS